MEKKGSSLEEQFTKQEIKFLIQKIFNSIFTTKAILDIREEIIKEIVNKTLENIYKVIEEAIDQYSSIKVEKQHAILYMIFSILKRARLRTSFGKYRQTVQ